MKVYELMKLLAECHAGADVHVIYDNDEGVSSSNLIDISISDSGGSIVFLDPIDELVRKDGQS